MTRYQIVVCIIKLLWSFYNNHDSGENEICVSVCSQKAIIGIISSFCIKYYDGGNIIILNICESYFMLVFVRSSVFS
jgi:hypothetical protein